MIGYFAREYQLSTVEDSSVLRYDLTGRKNTHDTPTISAISAII